MDRVVLVAGGTGGHINAALSIGEVLEERYEVEYFSGDRHLDLKLFSGTKVTHLNSKALRTKNPLKLLVNLFKNLLVFISIIKIFISRRPKFAIGAGGYVCGPTLLAAWILRVPIFIIEQNAIAGLTNKILGRIAKNIFVHFHNTKGFTNKEKMIITGNPIRSSIQFEEKVNSDNEINILVFGGSLGATQINIALSALELIKSEKQINIIHQYGKGNMPCEFKNQKVKYKGNEYLDNIEEQYRWADIIISRAGASTVSELKVIQKPSILIPYPQATDNHQYFNACSLKEEVSFPVYVLDHKSSYDELGEELLVLIEKIAKSNYKVENYTLNELSAAEKVVKEVENICLE